MSGFLQAVTSLSRALLPSSGIYPHFSPSGTDFNKAMVARNSLLKRISASVKAQVEQIKAEPQGAANPAMANQQPKVP